MISIKDKLNKGCGITMIERNYRKDFIEASFAFFVVFVVFLLVSILLIVKEVKYNDLRQENSALKEELKFNNLLDNNFPSFYNPENNTACQKAGDLIYSYRENHDDLFYVTSCKSRSQRMIVIFPFYPISPTQFAHLYIPINLTIDTNKNISYLMDTSTKQVYPVLNGIVQLGVHNVAEETIVLVEISQLDKDILDWYNTHITKYNQTYWEYNVTTKYCIDGIVKIHYINGEIK
jgi:hypothetical protein